MARQPANRAGDEPAITAQGGLAQEAATLLASLGVPSAAYRGGNRTVASPITGEIIAHVHDDAPNIARAKIDMASEAFEEWRTVPAPRRGELVRLFGNALRDAKETLGRLITIEVGKIATEGFGEVQEMIDICDFATGLSRQLYGLTMPSERLDHRLMEQWHPIGPVGVISAFNFPTAVWAWNAALALVCGDSVIWKPSEKAPLSALATLALFERTTAAFGSTPKRLVSLLLGDAAVGTILVDDPRVPVVSATGSTAMGRIVGERVQRRFGRPILELGGNNAAIVCPSADLDLAVRAIAFGACGTAGQRCTTLRRLIVHESVHDSLVSRLKHVYRQISVGDPRCPETLIGPLIDGAAFEKMQDALAAAKRSGGVIHGGERVVEGVPPLARYVRPALVEMPAQTGPMTGETFAPILYVLRYREFEDALRLHNGVAQGLSSAIFTTDMRETDRFLSAAGSDCGIANVNTGPSGAEIGGAFGGEKETGGGRESGSDAWKAYMRRMTSAINYGRSQPLAQGVTFDIGAGTT